MGLSSDELWLLRVAVAVLGPFASCICFAGVVRSYQRSDFARKFGEKAPLNQGKAAWYVLIGFVVSAVAGGYVAVTQDDAIPPVYFCKAAMACLSPTITYLVYRIFKKRDQRNLHAPLEEEHPSASQPRAEEQEKKQQARTERRLNQRREKSRQQEKRKELEKTLRRQNVADRSDFKTEQETSLPTLRDRSGLNAVAGMSSLKKQLKEEVVDVVQNPAKFQKYGISIPNGILLFGPPGCGKTYIARQLASELNCHFFEVCPSDIADSYVHGATMKIRNLFEQAVSKAPSVLFIDEFEALVPVRDTIGGHNQYKSEEVNEFLARMGTCSENGVLLIAASNAPWKIDPAVQRSGRIDKKIYVGPPDRAARSEILAYHLRGRYTTSDLGMELIAETLTGYSSSDLKLLVDEAAKLAVKSDEAIGEKHLNSARPLVPPSVVPQIEERYEQFKAGNTSAAARAVGFRV